jgi:putative spermidine/putrescine transport system permease protein
MIAWSLAAGWGFAFMISFGALEVSLFLSTSTMVTLPVQIYSWLDWSPLDPALTAISSGVVIITLAVLVVTARLVRLDRFLKRGSV